MTNVLKQRFFERGAILVARGLLGKILVHRAGKKRLSIMIAETEAYTGPRDLASHASRLWRGSPRAARGRTRRTEVMFGEAGRFYVYLTYGMHWMLNVVTSRKGYPAAVLIRGGVLVNKNGWSRPLRGQAASFSGPARLTKFLKIDKRFNGKRASRKTGLWFEDRGIKIQPSQIRRGPRVGVGYAGKWARKPYNFRIISKLRNE